LADWSFAPNQTKQLELHIYPVILGGKTRKLYFYDCHLVNWINDFFSTGNEPMNETLKITAAGVKDSNSMEEYSANWRVTFPQQEVEPAIRKEEELPEILESFYEDYKGNKINDKNINAGNIIYFNIKTSNANGKELSVNLSNNKLDFEYNDKVLKDDILRINVSSDHMKIKLKTIKQ